MNALEPALGFAVLDLHPIEHLFDVRLEYRRRLCRRRRDTAQRIMLSPGPHTSNTTYLNSPFK